MEPNQGTNGYVIINNAMIVISNFQVDLDHYVIAFPVTVVIQKGNWDYGKMLNRFAFMFKNTKADAMACDFGAGDVHYRSPLSKASFREPVCIQGKHPSCRLLCRFPNAGLGTLLLL